MRSSAPQEAGCDFLSESETGELESLAMPLLRLSGCWVIWRPRFQGRGKRRAGEGLGRCLPGRVSLSGWIGAPYSSKREGLDCTPQSSVIVCLSGGS